MVKLIFVLIAVSLLSWTYNCKADEDLTTASSSKSSLTSNMEAWQKIMELLNTPSRPTLFKQRRPQPKKPTKICGPMTKEEKQRIIDTLYGMKNYAKSIRKQPATVNHLDSYYNTPASTS